MAVLAAEECEEDDVENDPDLKQLVSGWWEGLTTPTYLPRLLRPSSHAEKSEGRLQEDQIREEDQGWGVDVRR